MARFGKKNKAEEIEEVVVENDTPVVETVVEEPTVEEVKQEEVVIKAEPKKEVKAEVESLADFLF